MSITAYVERAVAEGRPLFSDTAARVYGLTAPERDALTALLLYPDDWPSARLWAEGLDVDAESFDYAVRSLAKRGLVQVTPEGARFPELERRLEAPADVPEPRLSFRPLTEVVVQMARDGKNPVAGLAAVYSYVFGREVAGKEWAMLGKIYNALGSAQAALLFLELATVAWGDASPLPTLLQRAVGRAKEYRPEEAPDPEEQKQERRQQDEAAWRVRMRRWFGEYGGENHALADIAQAETFQRISPEQAEANRRQVRLDFERWRKAGSPPPESFYWS